MRFASQAFQGVPRFREQRFRMPKARDMVQSRARRGDAGMERLMNNANGLGNRAPQVGAPGVPNPAVNGNFQLGQIGIGTRLGGIL